MHETWLNPAAVCNQNTQRRPYGLFQRASFYRAQSKTCKDSALAAYAKLTWGKLSKKLCFLGSTRVERNINS